LYETSSTAAGRRQTKNERKKERQWHTVLARLNPTIDLNHSSRPL